jgi:hypothetical protein
MKSLVSLEQIFLITFVALKSASGLQMKSGANRAEAIHATNGATNRATSLDVKLEDESNIPHSRKKRSIIFPTGSDLTFDVGLSIPISALSATSNIFRENAIHSTNNDP